MYYVVEFLEEKTVAVVPNTWMETLQSCRWPPTTPEWSKKLPKLVKLKSQPEDCFGTYDVRVLGSSDILERAYVKANKSRETSDINTTDYDARATNRPKRKIRRKKMWSSSSEDDLSNEEEELADYIPPPQPPAVIKAPQPSQVSTPKVATRAESGMTPNFLPNSVLQFPISPFGRPSALEDTNTSGMGVEALLQLNAEFHKQILRKLRLIEGEQMRQRDLLSQLTNGSHQQNRLPNLPFTLPVSSEMELIAVEDFLKLDSNQDIMIRHLKLVGGAQLDIAVRGILSRCLTKGFASYFSYKGQRNKKPFRLLRLQKVAFGATQLHYPEVTEAEFSKIVGDWLRYVPRQKGGSKYCAEKTALRNQTSAMELECDEEES